MWGGFAPRPTSIRLRQILALVAKPISTILTTRLGTNDLFQTWKRVKKLAMKFQTFSFGGRIRKNNAGYVKTFLLKDCSCFCLFRAQLRLFRSQSLQQINFSRDYIRRRQKEQWNAEAIYVSFLDMNTEFLRLCIFVDVQDQFSCAKF